MALEIGRRVLGNVRQRWLCTILISAAALVLSTVLGLLLALARRSRVLALNYFGRVYVEIVRGTPLLVQIMILFYVVAPTLRVPDRYRVAEGVAILSLFSGAYIAEIIRAGIESVGALAIGIGPGHRPDPPANLPLCHFPAGLAPVPAAAGRASSFR